MDASTRKTVTQGVFRLTVAILVLLLIGVGVYAAYSTSNDQSTISSLQTANSNLTASLARAQVTQLAYAHFAAIGSENLTATMSQYGSNPVLYWVVSPSSPLNGTYSGTGAVQTTWSKFFKANPSAYYALYNLSVSVSGTSATVTTNVWYILGGGKVTLKLPYELVYTVQNGSWLLAQEYWGIPGNPGLITPGVLPTVGNVVA